MILYLLRYYCGAKLYSVLPVRLVKKIQIRKYRKLFNWARENSEFYKKIYADAGITDLEIKTIEDIKKIPIVTKDMMKAYGLQNVLTCDKTDKIIETSTSGSSGKPMIVYSNKKEYFAGYVRTFLAFRDYNPFKTFGQIGMYTTKSKIEKRTFLSYLQKKIGLFRYESISVFSPPQEIIQKITEKKINIISTTPTCAQVLINELKRTEKKLKIRTIVLSGETLFDELRKDIKTYLQGKIINVYGYTEHPSFSWTAPDKDYFTYPLNSSYIEYINTVEIDGERYAEPVLTNLVNKTMPFIRYHVGDQSKLLNTDNKIGKVIGRVDDIIKLDNGELLFMLQLYKFSKIHDYTQFKILQKKDRSIHFQAVCNQGVDKNKLRERIINTWNEDFSEQPIKVEFLKELPIDRKTGKFKKLEVEN